MAKNNDLVWQNYFNLPNPGLSAYFAHVREGNDVEFRTPFYKGKSVESVLKGWKPHLNKLSNTWPSLLEMEEDLAKKVGPMSIMKPLKDRIVDIDSYYDSILLDSKPISHSAVAAVCREWSKIGRLQLRSQKRTVEMMKKSTNSGNPYFTKRRAVVDKTIPCEMYYNYPIVQQWLKHHKWNACAILGWRGQEGGPTKDDVKQRIVWMFPLGVNISELQVYQPAIELAQRHGIVPAWIGMDAVDQTITKMFDTKGSDDIVLCTDFSKYDQHFNRDMQDAAREILKHILSNTFDSRRWLKETFPIKYAIPLAYDMKKIRYGRHGMGSGSGGTNFDETLTHRALQYEAAQSIGAKLNPYSQCLGDDGVLTFPGISADIVMQSYTAHGQEMNADKQYESKHDCTYLRRWHHKDYRINDVCVGVYSTCRALGKLCEQEHYYDSSTWSSKMVALRQLSIIENCKYHPLREEFVEYCMKGDKYHLGVDIPGFLDNIESVAQEAIDLMPDFLGYTKSQMLESRTTGISNWWIVRYLKSR